MGPRRLRALLIVLSLALALVVAGNSALSIALPDLAGVLGADQRELTWVIDAYALTFAALLLPAGIVADRIGRRTVLTIGLVIFGGAGIASAFAPEPSTLILWRAVAGAGAAAVFPVTLSALVDAYPEKRRSFAVAVWSGVSAAGAVVGTLIAGLLLEFFWWGSVQLVFGGLALLLVIPALLLVAQSRDPSLSLDPLGALLSAIALGCIVYGVIEAPERGWLSGATLAALGVGLLALLGFVAHELRTRAPSLDVRLFRSRGLSTGSLIVSVQFFASLGLFVLAPQYLQLVRNHEPLQAAATLLVIPVGVGAGTGLAPALLTRLGARAVGAAGLATMGVGLAAMAVILLSTQDPPLLSLAPGLLGFGLGFGLAVTPGTILIIDGLPENRRSVASAVNDITREVGGVLGIAVLSSILLMAYRDSIAPALAGVPPAVAAAADNGAGPALAVADQLGPAGPALASAARAAFATGVGAAFAAGAGILLLAAAVCAVLGPRHVRATRPTDATDAGSTSAGPGRVAP